MFHTEEFEMLKKELPLQFSQAQMLGEGGFSIVADHMDGTVSKVILRADYAETNMDIDGLLKTEMDNLRILNANPGFKFEIPELLSDLTYHDSENFYASFRMTKVSGSKISWFKDNGLPADELSAHFNLAGQALAETHEYFAKITAPWTTLPDMDHAGEIYELHFLDNVTNTALRRANDYLQEHKQPGIIHGDYHAGNILVEGDKNERRVCSILDFDMTGMTDNYLYDFKIVPSQFFPSFLQGYEKVKGEKIDPDLMALTSLSLLTQRAMSDDPDGELSAFEKKIQRKLEQISHISRHP